MLRAIRNSHDVRRARRPIKSLVFARLTRDHRYAAAANVRRVCRGNLPAKLQAVLVKIDNPSYITCAARVVFGKEEDHHGRAAGTLTRETRMLSARPRDDVSMYWFSPVRKPFDKIRRGYTIV